MTVDELAATSFAFVPAAACRRCLALAPTRGEPDRSARLYLHTELGDRRERMESGGWDLVHLARRFGVTGQVVFDRTLRPGAGISRDELARRMAACDLHLLLFECGGFELTVLETGACGVANVITDTSAPPEYAAPFSRLVPVATHTIGPAGVRGLADLDVAVRELFDLAASPAARAELGRAGVAVAAAHTWARVGVQWHELLTLLAVARPTTETGTAR